MGCLRGSKFTCILSLSRVCRPRSVPRDLGAACWRSLLVATARCSSETPRATLVRVKRVPVEFGTCQAIIASDFASDFARLERHDKRVLTSALQMTVCKAQSRN